MFRTITSAAILALTMTAAQAGDLSSRIHEAAVVACAPESVSPANSYYGAITEHCIDRISHAAMARIQAEAEAKAARARLANN